MQYNPEVFPPPKLVLYTIKYLCFAQLLDLKTVDQ